MNKAMNKFMNKGAFLAMALVMGATAMAGTASAQDMRHEQPGKVVVVQQHTTTVKHVVVRGKLFSKLDTNRNGAVSKVEFARHYGNGRAAMRAFARADTNRSGNLSATEVANARTMLHTLKHA